MHCIIKDRSSFTISDYPDCRGLALSSGTLTITYYDSATQSTLTDTYTLSDVYVYVVPAE